MTTGPTLVEPTDGSRTPAKSSGKEGQSGLSKSQRRPLSSFTAFIQFLTAKPLRPRRSRDGVLLGFRLVYSMLQPCCVAQFATLDSSELPMPLLRNFGRTAT